MKPYIKYIHAISKADIFKGLLAHGFFVEKIPPFLSSEAFYNYCVKENINHFEGKAYDYIRYESMRNINIPRQLAIPNPFSYANLCKHISEHWTDLQTYFEKKLEGQTHKISRIHLRKMKGKDALFEMNYQHADNDGNPCEDIIIKNKYRVEADISSCFPSIYSHSIAWAIAGKEEAKKNHDQKKWHNKLDTHVRNTKNGETNGILTGPHAFNLISEIILLSVDKKLWESGYKYIRNIDDYTCYVSSYEEAEKFLMDLAKELKVYELHLNHKKTVITKLPTPIGSIWVNKLNSFHFDLESVKEKKPFLKLKQLKTFLDLAIELALENKNTAVLSYAIKIIASKNLGKKARNYYTKQIYHLLLLYPYLVHWMEEFVFVPFELEVNVIKQIGTDLYQIGIKQKLYEACSFAIYWSIKYNYKLDVENIYEDAKNSHDCIFLLLAYLRTKKDQNKSQLTEFKKEATQLLNADFERFWLFVYEVLPACPMNGDYARIKKANISFITKEILAQCK